MNEALHYQNLLAAETGGRSYCGLSPETGMERAQRERRATMDALALRLKLVDANTPKVKADKRYKELRER